MDSDIHDLLLFTPFTLGPQRSHCLIFYVILTPREIFYKTNVVGRQTVKAIIINFIETSPVTLCM